MWMASGGVRLPQRVVPVAPQADSRGGRSARQEPSDPGEAAVGARVAVYWTEDEVYYKVSTSLRRCAASGMPTAASQR
jgi:hypothetical protein